MIDRKLFLPVAVLLRLGLTLGGYTLAPKYTRPGAPVPAQWPTGSVCQGTRSAEASPAAERENLKLSRSTLEVQDASYKLIRKRYDMGMANELDLRRAQSHVDAARGPLHRPSSCRSSTPGSGRFIT